MTKVRIAKILVILFLILPCMTLSVTAADQDSIIREQTQKSGATDLYNKVPDNAKKMLNELDMESVDSGSLSKFTPAGIFKIILEKIQSAVSAPLKAVTVVLGILLAYSLLNTMKNSFGENTLKSVFDTACTLCIAGTLLTPVIGCVTTVANVIKGSSEFMLTFLPVFTALVTASGHPASAVAYQSLMMISSQLISEIAATTFVPMVDIYLAFCVIGSVSPGININGIAEFARKIVQWGLVLCATVFTGILTVQSLISQAADTVTMKTAKFVIGNVIPVIGSTIDDALNTVISCANLLKTVTGAYAIVVFLLIFLPPILDCLLWLLAAELSMAVAQMLNIPGVLGLLKSIKEALKLLIALILTCALTMIVSVSIMLLIGMNS